jgi:SAM-dependent methyltransferase
MGDFYESSSHFVNGVTTPSMSTAKIQGALWGTAPGDWTDNEQHHVPLFQAMLEAAGVADGTRLLDAGCGGGTSAGLAMQRGAKVTALDASEGLIAHARKAFPGPEYCVGDIEELPFEDGSFDAVVAANSVQYAGDLVTTLGELKRVCIPGGRVVAGLFGPPETVAFAHVFAALKEVMPPPPPNAKKGGPFALSADGVLAGFFEQAGLSVTGSSHVDVSFNYPNEASMWRAMTSAGPFQGMMKVVDEQVLREAMLRACKRFTADDGSIDIKPNRFIYVTATS